MHVIGGTTHPPGRRQPLRKAEARTVEAICTVIAQRLTSFIPPTGCEKRQDERKD